MVDVVESLTDPVNPTDYLKKIRKRDSERSSNLGTNCPQVTMVTETGKYRQTLAANVKSLFRIIQSIPSPKAETFKQWLAQVGYDRILEIENPELAQERMKSLYEQKGYPKDWIDKRLRGIATRQNLTDEWKEEPDTFGKIKKIETRGGKVAGVARREQKKSWDEVLYRHRISAEGRASR